MVTQELGPRATGSSIYVHNKAHIVAQNLSISLFILDQSYVKVMLVTLGLYDQPKGYNTNYYIYFYWS